MNMTPGPSRFLFAAAMITLGITGIVNGGFALVWQNVPEHVAGRDVLAYVCAIIELASGVGLLFSRTAAAACRVLFPYMLLWLVLLEVPGVIQSPLDANAWGGIGETGAITAGTWCLFAIHAGAWETNYLDFAAGLSGIRAARWLLIVALPALGAEVMVSAAVAGDAERFVGRNRNAIRQTPDARIDTRSAE